MLKDRAGPQSMDGSHISEAAKANGFLQSLSDRDRARVEAAGTRVAVEAGFVLHRAGEVMREIWFPLDSAATLGAATADGAGAGVAVIGREGLVGVTEMVGESDVALNDAVVQVAGEMLRVPVERLRQEMARSATLRRLFQRFAQALFVQMSQAAACARFHTLEQRLSCCLLFLHDHIDGDDIPITHERLGAMLGSFRPSITLAARALQEAHAIDAGRGRITIRDRARLTAFSCECYDVIASEYARLLDVSALRDSSLSGAFTEETLRDMNSHLLVAALREQERREKAEEANDVTALFFATLAHEMRTPLTSILGWADVLRAGGFDDETLALAIDTIHRNAKIQQRLVDDMFDLAQMRAGVITLEREPLDAGAVAREAVTSSRPAAEAHGVAISVIVDDAVTVRADRVRMQQILANLLSNALKFTPPGGVIEVVVTSSESQVRVDIRDSGRGIDAALLPHVFEEFRSGDATTGGERGLGLGLSIVRQLVALHGGEVEIGSGGAGAGTTVSILLPRLT
ncbi:MAG TPA: ATP-binding protein [Thermoanaerobaculia bacterium]